jgi:hypothetical protein
MTYISSVRSSPIQRRNTLEIFISTIQFAYVALSALIAVGASVVLLGIIGFVIYAEYFDPSRFSCPWDYLTPEEMEMIKTDGA